MKNIKKDLDYDLIAQSGNQHINFKNSNSLFFKDVNLKMFYHFR